MPGAGTDKTRRWIETPAPVVVLVEPQLGENIGAAARAMANFGLSKLRVVKPLQGWPNERARVMASGADRILDGAVLYESLSDAIADCTFVLATTARVHDQAKPVMGADQAAAAAAHAGRIGRDRGAGVRARAHRAGKPRGGDGRRHRHAAGQPGLRLAQPGAGGGDRRLRMVQARRRRRSAVHPAGKIAAGGQAAACVPSLPTSTANWRRPSSSGRKKSAAP